MTETFGNVTLEAMASGLAVLAFDYAAASEYIVDGRNGHLAPLGNSEAYTRAATAMAGSGLGLRATGAAARITAQGLDWEHVILGLEALLLSVSAGGPALSGAAAGLALPESI